MGNTSMPADAGACEILVVDDNEACSAALREFLFLADQRTLAALSAEQALDLFREHHPCAVITDNVMPGNDGLWLGRCLKRDAPGIPVIMLSADPPPEAQSVCDVVLNKPVRLAEVLDALARLGVLRTPCVR